MALGSSRHKTWIRIGREKGLPDGTGKDTTGNLRPKMGEVSAGTAFDS